jgi:diadenylate cyclase
MLIDLWRGILVHVVDILVVSYLIYRLLVLIQGTRAVQVLLGIIVLAATTEVVQGLLRLPTLGWLLRQFWMGSVVIFAVVFQPEIRSALAHLGSHRAGRFFIHAEPGVVEEIVTALKEASRRKMGMLLVLEQEIGLRNFIETGTFLNAELTRELLLSLFQPPAILHDGAIIVRGQRVVAAGCVLPLSTDPGLSKILGTRHRAAVGITEISDAWALLVSEETGAVSVARGGKLDYNVNVDEFRKQLLHFYHAEK